MVPSLSGQSERAKNAIPGFSLRTEVAGGYFKVTGESGHSEKHLPSRLLKAMET